MPSTERIRLVLAIAYMCADIPVHTPRGARLCGRCLSWLANVARTTPLHQGYAVKRTMAYRRMVTKYKGVL